MKFPRYKGKVMRNALGEMYEVGTFRVGGKSFSSGGAQIWLDPKTGKQRAILYAYPKEGKVGTWDGKQKWDARFGAHYYSPVGGSWMNPNNKVRHVSTVVNGIRMGGILGEGKDFIKFSEGR